MKSPIFAGLGLVLLVAACSKGSSEATSSSANASAAPSGSGAPGAAPPAASAAPSSAPAAPRAWRGTYKSAESTFTLPQGVGWKVAPVPAGVGEGAIALTVDPSTGRVRGTLEGPLGPATLDGLLSDGRLTANVARRDPTDHGFAGTLDGEVSGTAGHGTIRASLADVTAVRAATFEVAPAAATAPPADGKP
jgi:hypothetical protein